MSKVKNYFLNWLDWTHLVLQFLVNEYGNDCSVPYKLWIDFFFSSVGPMCKTSLIRGFYIDKRLIKATNANKDLLYMLVWDGCKSNYS